MSSLKDIKSLKSTIVEDYQSLKYKASLNESLSPANYDFTGLIGSLSKIDNMSVSSSVLNDIKFELNKFYSDSVCTQVIYTRNTDKMFFGMCVYPNLTPDDVKNIVTAAKEPDRFKNYIIELDSRLFVESLSLTAQELTAILLHEVGHIVNSNAAAVEICDAYQQYQTKTGTSNLNSATVMSDIPLHQFTIQRTLRALGSIFEKDDEEFIADRFAVQYGFAEDLESAFKKIQKNKQIHANKNPFVTLIWAMRINKELRARKRSVCQLIDAAEGYSGSSLEKGLFKSLKSILQVRSRTTTNILAEDVAVEANLRAFNELGFIKKLKLQGLRTIEDDLYEYSIKLVNISSEWEAVQTMRAISNRINMLSDFLHYENIDEAQKERVYEMINKFRKLREDLMAIPAYRHKQFGLFVELPEVNGRVKLS